MNEELEQLKIFHAQLQKMFNYFYKEKRTKRLANALDKIRSVIARKMGSLEGWYTGEVEF